MRIGPKRWKALRHLRVKLTGEHLQAPLQKDRGSNPLARMYRALQGKEQFPCLAMQAGNHN